ncbi:Mucin-5B [Plecturocebus cupreus]
MGHSPRAKQGCALAASRPQRVDRVGLGTRGPEGERPSGPGLGPVPVLWQPPWRTGVPSLAHCAPQEGICRRTLLGLAFAECQALVDSAEYLAACTQDLCHCPTCPCATFSEYSRQCAHAGGQPQNWRRPDLCRECPRAFARDCAGEKRQGERLRGHRGWGGLGDGG